MNKKTSKFQAYGHQVVFYIEPIVSAGSRIIIPESTKKELKHGIIVSVGDDVKGLNVGDKCNVIMFNAYVLDNDHFSVLDESVICKIVG